MELDPVAPYVRPIAHDSTGARPTSPRPNAREEATSLLAESRRKQANTSQGHVDDDEALTAAAVEPASVDAERARLWAKVHPPRMSTPDALVASARSMVESERRYRESAYKLLRTTRGLT